MAACRSMVSLSELGQTRTGWPMPRHRMADATASVALDHVAGDEVVEEERLDLGGALVGFRW